MPENSKKFLWIGLAASVFILAVAAAIFFVFSPRDMGRKASFETPTKDYLALPPTTGEAGSDQAPVQPGAQNGGDIIIVYGEDSAAKPATTPTASIVVSPPPAPTPAPTPTPAPKAVAVAPSEPAKASPPPAPKPAPKPAAKPAIPAPAASPASSGYWIQTGSFVQKSSADALKKGFEDNNYSARINVKDIDGKSYYQVRVGPYASREEAQKSLGSVKSVPGASSGSFVTQ